jgi:predicted PurR-regulated permease PerM
VDVTAATFFRLLGVVILVWVWLRLWQWIMIFVAAVFLAIALDPLVKWLDGRGIRRRFAGPLVVLLLALVLAGFFYFSGSELKGQAGLLGDRINETQRQIGVQIPDVLKQLVPSDGAGGGSQGSDRESAGYLMRFGRALVWGVLSIAVALVLTAYLLIDGRRTYEWFVAFAAPEKRPRIHRTAAEARLAVLGYMRGNVATSVLAAIVTFVVLAALKVPAALLLALVAGILNFIPVVGLMLSLVPAVLLALTVSPGVAAAVAAFYLGYNAIENYYIQPKVYGHEMQLSSLAVLAAFAAGAELGGVIGALIALPIAAMYPPIESLWLKGPLDPAAVEDHRRIERTAEH